MSLLALVAMLLLLCLPSVGRVLSAGHASSSSDAWTQMCTMAGLKLVKLAPTDANPLTPESSGDGDMPTQGQGDCAYCPVLNAMVALLLCAVFAFHPTTMRLRPDGRVPFARSRWHPCGLGSRGPPIAL